MHDTVMLRVTHNCSLDALRDGRWQSSLLWDGAISHLSQRFAMYLLTEEAIILLQYLLPCGICLCISNYISVL